MASPTPNKGYAQPDTGDFVNAWGPVIDANFALIDENLGGSVAITETSGTYELTSDDAANACLTLSVTLAGDLTISLPAGKGGFYFLNTAGTTFGSYTVTVSAGGTTTATVTAAGYAILFTDGSSVYNFTPAVTIPTHVDIPAGTAMTFIQESAPTGWTLSTAQNDVVLRINSSEGGGTGGAWELSGLTVGDTTLTTGQIPAHDHSVQGVSFNVGSGTYAVDVLQYNGASSAGHGITENTGGGGAHDHSLTADGAWRPAYVDAIVATRDS